MLDPNYTVVSCPNGHQLQAAVADAGKVLSCPICNAVFNPSGGPPMVAVVPMSYAVEPAPLPISRPAYTFWLLTLWVICEVLGAAYNCALVGMEQDPQNPHPVLAAGSCFVMVLFLPAVVLQLMWIYRLHDDARRRGYQEVSPGLALGLCFIPAFAYIWTAWTLRRLAAFAASRNPPEDSVSSRAVSATRVCFYMGIVKALANCGSGISMVLLSLPSQTFTGGGLPTGPLGGTDSRFYPLLVVTSLLAVVTVVVYAWTAPKVEASIYRPLAADATSLRP